jgi:pimeloyl-ACP methyl ester carboxylesterase
VIARRLPLATGLTYQLLELGADDARDLTIVLVHGFLDLAAGWGEVAARLADRAHVIAPDLRGHGDSDWIGAGGYYHFMDYVADLDDVIAQAARRRVVVVGHSMGGSVAAYWAGVRPDRPLGLVLLEGLGPPELAGEDVGGRAATWIDAWRTAGTPRRRGRAMASLDEAAARLRKHDPRLDELRARRLAEAGTRHDDDGLRWKHDPLHLTAGPYPFRLEFARAFWQRVTCPVRCVDGAQSALNLPDDERARRRGAFREVRHHVVDQAGHMLQRHQPVEVARLIAAFVDDLAPEPAAALG